MAPLVALERTVASRYAARLEASGLVRKTVDTDDRRVTLLELTEGGISMVAVLRTRLAAELESKFASWPESLVVSFVEGLERFVRSRPSTVRCDCDSSEANRGCDLSARLGESAAQVCRC